MIFQFVHVGAEHFPEARSKRGRPFLFGSDTACRFGGKFRIHEEHKFTIAGIPHTPENLPGEPAALAQVREHFHIETYGHRDVAQFVPGGNIVQQVLERGGQFAG